jgi:hypothetical protein
MKNEIFKKGDRVYDYLYGWGKVVSCYSFPVEVLFDSGRMELYTWDGRLTFDANPTLSFTEYKLGEFSQKRPEPETNFPCTGLFDHKRFGICVGVHESGLFMDEGGYLYIYFEPMTFEGYCEMEGIEL